ncbi:MAG: energy transducer TonB [bacterium]
MSSFENQKNIKAGAYTIVLVGVLIGLCFIIGWTPPMAPALSEEEGMEVNLGDSETGLGDVQPLIPGEPAAPTEEQVAQPTPEKQIEPTEKEIETNDNDKEAPPAVISKPKVKPTPKPVTPPTPTPVKTAPQPKEEVKPVEAPPAPAPKPKYIYKGQGNKTEGGNNSQEIVKGEGGQGITSGKGDQGKLTGDPNSDSYTGTGGSGSGGVSVSRGLQGRKINRFPSFQDDFNENAKVAVDIKVDAKGNVISAGIQPRGTTTGNSSMKAIALQKARQLRFTPDDEGPDEQLGTIIFDFRIKN